MKKNWKRILSMFLAFVMVFGMLPVSAFADETEPVITEETSVTEPAAAEAAALSEEETTAPVTEPPVEETTVPVTEAPVAETTVPETEAPVVETTVPETEAPVVETTVPETEAPVVETTVPETETPVVETTVPETEAPVVETTVPETEAPVVETTVPETETPEEETQPVKNKVSDSAANEAATEASEPAETESEVTEPEATRKIRRVAVVPGSDFPDNDTLFAGYADHVWFGTDIAFFGTSGREQLNADTQAVYDALVPLLKAIARGDRTSALLKVGATLDSGDSYYVADAEVSFNEANLDVGSLQEALLADIPYEMYWYDKTAGLTHYAEYGENDDFLYYFYFSVAGQYNDGSYETFEYEDGSLEDVYYTADSEKISAVQDAAAAAQTVVDEVAADSNVTTDYDKLLAYKEWICENTSYNEDVKNGDLTFSENIDPWQVIYVFDGDDSTAVVCEGYSKAFQYLCELTDFSTDSNGDENVTCYSVTGTLVGEDTSGAHMWNIVEIDGQNYLADITNSDEGTVGDDGSLFLVGTAPETAGTYIFDTKGTSTTKFIYDADTNELWGSSGILTLAESSYEAPVEEPEVPDPSEPSEPSDEMTQAEFEAVLADNVGTNYTLTQSVTITEDMTVHMGTDSVPYNHSIRIPEGITLTVADGATLTVETNLSIDGGTVIVEEGSCLAIGSSDTNGMLYIWGGTLDVAEESGLVMEYGRMTVEYGSGHVIPGWIDEGSINAQAYIREPEQMQEMLALTQYAFIDIYVQCDLTVDEDITIGANQFLGVQNPFSMTVSEGVTVTVEPYGTLFNSSVINNNGRILCYGEFQNYGTLNGNQVEIEREETDEATFLEEMAGSGGYYRLSKNLTITGNVEIPAGQVVYVDDSTTLTVAEGATVTVNGQLSTNNGSIIVNGTLINNGWMHIDSISSTGSITIGSDGTWQNNSGMFLGGGAMTIDGTYTGSENAYVSYDDTKAEIYGIEKIGDQLQLQIIANTEEELIGAMERRENIEIQQVYTDSDITLNSDLTIPEGINLTICYSWGDGSDYKTLTIAEGVTLTVEGSLGVAERGEILVEAGATLRNNGWIGLDGQLVLNGSLEGNEVEIYNGTIITGEMSQADFEAAVAEAAENGETYNLNHNVTLTEDMTITGEVHVNTSASLTVDGCTLTVGDGSSFCQLIASGGTITVLNGAALNITVDGLIQVWSGGTLTLEDGADIDGVDADEVWVNLTVEGENTVNGLENHMLGAVLNPHDAEGIEAAFALTDTYASVGVYPRSEDIIVLDRDIVIPEGDSLNLMDDCTMKVPAGYTLTNNGWISIGANNRLEILQDAELVNNATINVDDYAQLVIRGTLSGEGTIEGNIVWGEMTHEELIEVIENCNANGSSWVHESETVLDPNVNGGVLEISMGDGPAFYLAEGGVIRVPDGCTLKVFNPLILIGGKVIVEAGGTLDAGEGHMEIGEGTLYVEEGGNVIDNGHIQGRITWANETDPWLSETWLDNRNDEGWYWPEENTLHEAHGLHVMDCHWRIYFLNTWDAENMVWNSVPVIPTEVSEYMTITRIMDMEDEHIREDQEYAEYFVCVDIYGTLEHQDVNLFVNGTAYPYELFDRTVAFYSAPEISMDTIVTNGHHSMSGETEEEAVYWLVKEPECYDVLDFSWNAETWGEDYTQYTGGDPLIVLDESQKEQGIYKFIIDPDYVEFTKYTWKNFNLQVHMELDYNQDGEDNINIEYWDRDIWVEPAPQAQPQAHLRINNQTYLVYENDIIFRDFFTGEYDEWGNEIWGRERCTLPDGVSYVLEENKLILDNAHLERLELSHMDCWEDEDGYHEEQRLPSADVSLVVYGESSIMNYAECAVAIRNGTNVSISGTGSLHLYANNSPSNTDENGNCYAYPTMVLAESSSLNLSGNVSVTAEVAGYGFHGDYPAQMEAISAHNDAEGSSDNTLTLSGNAQLTIVTPEGTRTLDESQESYGGARGIINVSIEVSDDATLNTDTIYLWEGVDFTMNGGTVNLDPLGEVFYNYRLEDLLLSNLGIYLEHDDSVFTMNGGTINMDLNPNEANDGNFNYNTFQGINAALGHVYINGGEININGEYTMGGNGIAIQCGFTDEGPDFEGPASSLHMTGGTVNISAAEGEFEGVYVAPAAYAQFSGGAVNAYGGEHYLTGSVDWTGDAQLNGNVSFIEGTQVTVKDGATMVIDQEATVMDGARVIVEDGGTLHVGGWLTVEDQGLVLIRHGGNFTTEEGEHVSGKITFEGDTAPFLTSTWLDNDGDGWYMNDEFHVTEGLMSMDEHWRIFFLNTWDATNLVWNSVPVVPTEDSEFMTITRVLDMEDQIIREDQEYSEYFVCVNITGTLDYHEVSLYANGYTLPFRIYDRATGFYRTPEASLDTIIPGHDFTLDTTAEENAIYWIVKNPEDDDVLSWEVTYNTWDEDYTEYTGGDDLVTVTDLGNGVYKFTVDPDYVDYIQYDWKNFEIQMYMVLDYNGDDQILEEHYNYGLWMHAPELKQPAAVLNINNSEYMIFDTGRIFRDVFGGFDEWGNEIWRRQETALPNGVSYVLEDNKIILDNADLTSMDLHPTVSGYDEEGNYWEASGLPNENLTISLVGSSTIENHCNPALRFNDGTNVTITGNGSLYAKTTNYPDYRDENGELQCSNTINVHGGSTLTIGGNATVTAELAGHGYWPDGEGATCHPVSGSYSGDTLEITGNATLTTVLPNGVRRYDDSGTTSQIGGYVGIQNFNSITVSGGTLNTDHLNFYDGGEFNLTGGVANFKDIGGINVDPENGELHYHYEGINTWGGSVNISGGELNIDASPRDGETPDQTSFYGINAIGGTIDISGGTVNITGGTSDGWAILADCQWTNEGWVDGTGSTISVTDGTINVNAADKTYHGGILVSEICEGYFSGGKINDDYGVHRFFGETVWENTELYGVAANVYTHGPGSFFMSGGVIDLVGDSYEENGEIIRNRAIFQPNGGGSIYGGEIKLTNGTYINNMNVSFDGGKITIENDWSDVPGLENNLYFATTGGTIDITANGPAIVNNGTFHQMGGEITAASTNTELPAMVSIGSTMLNTGTLNIRGGNIGMVQAYNFDLVDDGIDDNESMLFVGDVSGEPVPELNISDTKIGLYLNGPAMLTGGAIVNIHAEGEPVNTDRDWPMAIYVEKHTGNPDLTGENVSGLIITGDANVTLVSEDTASVDPMSKGIVAWYSPVVIQGSDETDIPKVTIDAEMAVYSVSDSLEDTNFNDDIAFFDYAGSQVTLTSRDFTETEETGDYLHTLMDGDNYIGYASVGKSSVMGLDAFLAAVAEAAANNEPYELTERITVDRNVDLGEFGWVRICSGGELLVKDGAVLTNLFQINVEKGGKLTVEVGGRLVNQGAILVEGGTVSISDDGDYAGYVHDSELYVGRWAYGTEISPVTGIPEENMILQAECTTEDQINYILANRAGYFEVLIGLRESMTLNTMTIPENVSMSAGPDVTVTVAEGAFLTVNGMLSINGTLNVNGFLINNSDLYIYNQGTVAEGATMQSTDNLVVNDDACLNVCGILAVTDGTADIYGTLEVNGNVGTGSAVVTIHESGQLLNYNWYGVDAGTLVVNGSCDNYGTISVTWTDEAIGTVSGNVNSDDLTLWMPISEFFPDYGESEIAAMQDYAQQNGFGETKVEVTRDFAFASDFTVPENMTLSIGVYQDDTNYHAATVTVPAGKTLTVNGNLEVATMSSLVIEEGAELIFNGDNFNSYGNLVNNGTILVDKGYADIMGTYEHGENAQVILEAYDEDSAELYGIDQQLITLIYRGNDELRLVFFLSAMSYNRYAQGNAYIDGPMTMTRNWYAEPYTWDPDTEFDVDIYITGEGTVLTVPETDTGLGINTSIYVQDGGCVNVTGALYSHADMLIMDGGTVTVDGTMSSNTVYVYEGGRLIVNGNWDGYNPINYGGTIEGECFRLTQDKLEQLLAEGHSQVIMRSSLTLERDMTIGESGLVVAGEGYVLTVPEGVTLTVNSTLQLNLGGKLDVRGTLVCNGTIIVSGDGTELVNNGTVNTNGNIHELMNGKIVNNGIWNERPGGTCGDNLSWEINEDGVLIISGTGEMGDFYAGGGGYSIPWSAYEDMITKIDIRDGVTSISAMAFTINNGYDIEVSIPDSVTTLGEWCFESCDFTSIALPDGITIIPDGAFMNCSGLTEIHLPANLTRIEDDAFRNCDSLKTFEIPENVTYLGASVFFDCDNLESVTFCGDAPEIAPEYVGAIFDRNMTAYYPAGNDTWNEDTLQDYNYETTTWIPYYPSSSFMSLDEFLAAVAEATANNEFYQLTRSVIVDRDVELNGRGITIDNGAELLVTNGAVMTSNLEIQVLRNGKLTVEAGSRMVNQNSFSIEGTVSISDDGDYAGFVHNTAPYDTLVGVYADGTYMPSVIGIPDDLIYLQASCYTEDQVNFILGNCTGYAEILIRLEESMTLHTMTIPENTRLSTVPEVSVTVAEGAFLTVNGGLNIRNGALIVNGKLINNAGMNFNLDEVIVNGTFENNAPTFINDASVLTVNGTLNSYAPLHVGFWRDSETASPAGTLIIAEGGVLNNYDYLNICADAYEAEDDRYSGGIVTVSGTLNNLFNDETQNLGFIEQHGDLTVDGHLYSEGILGVNGAVVVNGSLTSQNTIDINANGTLDLYGDLENNGSLRLNGANSRLTTHEGASLVNNMSVSNRTLGAVITLAEGTYTQGSYSYNGVTEYGELVQTYFDGGQLTEINGAPEGTLSLMYEGSNADTLLTVSEMFNWNRASYDRCYLRVVAPMTFPEGKELNLASGSYLVVMNDGNNFTGSLTVEGRIYNQGAIRIFAADLTIAQGGYILNENELTVSGTAYGNARTPSFTVAGLLENAHNGTAKLDGVQLDMVGAAVIQNNLKGDQLGKLSGVPIADQTLFCDITEGTQERLQEVIGIVKNDGYKNGYFFVSEDMHITSSTVIPENIGISVQNGATLTIDPGVILQLDSTINVDAGGKLDVYGTLGIGGNVDVRGTMYVDAYGNVGMGTEALVTVMDGGELTIQGYFGVDGGTLTVDPNGILNNNGTISVTWTESRIGTLNADVTRKTLYMPINSMFSGHDEADIQAMLAYAEANGFTKTNLHITTDFTFTNDFTVPGNMTMIVGAYQNESNYLATTVTVPAGLTLTVDGRIEVAKKSSLVIEEGAQLIQNGEITCIILNASNVASTGKIKLSWNKVEGASKYEVYRATSLNGTYTRLSTTSVTSLTNTSAEVGKTYYYKVRAIDADGNKSEFSNIVERTCDLASPTLKATNVASTGKIKLTWNKVDGASKYRLYRSIDGGESYSLLKETTGTSLTNTSVEAGIKYYYKIMAVHGTNTEADSAESAVISIVCDLARPTASVSNDPVTGNIVLTWNAVVDAAGYELYRSDDGGESWSPLGTFTETTFTDDNIDAGSEYSYTVVAVHGSDSEANSAESEAVTGIGVLARPTVTLSKVASSGKIKLTWSAIDGATGYEVYRSTDDGATWSLLKETTGTSLTNTSTETGKTYSYKVMAIYDSNSEANSTFSEVVTGVCALPRPTVTVTNVASSGKIKLTWTKVEGASKYQIYRSTDGGITYDLLSTSSGTSLTNTSTVAGTKYYYKVMAIHGSNSEANSAFSSVVSRVCDLPRPSVKISNDALTGKIRLTWSAVEGAGSYEVHRSTDGGASYSLLDTITETTLTDMETEAGSKYYYKVLAVHESNSSANSAFSSVVSRVCDLASPTVSVSTVASSGKIKLTWTAVEGAGSYEVYRSTDGESWSLLKETTGTTLTNTSTEAGLTYYYKVLALHDSVSDAHSAYSEVVSAVCALPRPSVKVANVASTGKIQLTWSEIADVAGYEVYRSVDGGTTYSLLETTTELSLTDEDTEAASKYYYKVLARHSSTSEADSAFSSVVSRVCDLPRPTVKVSNVTSSGKIKLTWNEVEGAASYEVYRSTDGGETYSLLKETTGTSLTNTSTEAGSKYYYKVLAVHESNSSANSAYSSVVSRVCDLPRPTVKISTVASTGKIKLTWNKITDASKYKVYRSTDGGETYSLLSTTTGTSFTNTSVEAGNKYYYKVFAVHVSNSSANSAYSSAVSAVCDLPSPTVSAANDADTGKILLSWDAVEGAVSYEVYRSDNDGETFSLLAETSETGLTDEDTVAGSQYSYKVLAHHETVTEADSAYSTEVSAVCDLPRPTVTVSNVASSGKIKLTWNEIEDAESYEIYRSTDGGETYSLLSDTTGTSFTNTSTEAGTKYYYKVVAVHGTVSEASSAYSEEVFRVCDLARPTLTVTLNTSGKPKLSWTKITGATKYQVYRSTDGGASFTLLSTTTGTSLTNTSVTAGNTYHYRVRALHSNSSAYSAYSTTKSIAVE